MEYTYNIYDNIYHLMLEGKNDIEIRLLNVGDCGVAITRLAPMGMAEINSQRIEVYTSTSYVEPGTALVVEAVEGNKVRVREQIKN